MRQATYIRAADGKLIKSRQVNRIIEHDVLSEVMSHIPMDFEIAAMEHPEISSMREVLGWSNILKRVISNESS